MVGKLGNWARPVNRIALTLPEICNVDDPMRGSRAGSITTINQWH